MRISESEDLPACRELPSVTEYDERYGNGRQSRPVCFCIFFGPSCVSILGVIVLLFQAILLAHGGLTTLGANTFSMAIAGPFLSWGLYALLKRLKVNRRVSIFLAAALGDLFTYCVTSLQLALAYPSHQGGVAASALS